MAIRARWAVLLLAVLFLSSAWADGNRFGSPKILALGDSLTFGYQEHKVLENPFDLEQFHTGFAFVFTRLVKLASRKPAQLFNLGCPGETTGSFLDGPCVYHARGFPLHHNYSGSQIGAAEAVLRQHRGNVKTILISLGANDVLGIFGSCPTLDPACVAAILPGILATVGQNLSETLARLRAAAPNANIVLLQLYNPLELTFPGSNVLATSLNNVIGSVAAAYGANVANAFPAFNLAPPQPRRLCFLTLMCGLGGIPAGDIHASDAGYALIAGLMFKAVFIDD